MTIDALRHLAELLNDAAGYATAVSQADIAADLAQAAYAALLLAEDERAAASIRRRNRPRPRRTTPEPIPA